MPVRTIAPAFLALLAVLPGAQQQARALRPDPALQAALRELATAPDEAAQRAALDALRAGAGPAHAALVPQLLVFKLGARDTREAMAAAFVLRALAIPPQDVVAALVPLLESDDAPLRAEVAGVLAEYEDASVERGPDFGVYRPYLGTAAGESPVGLVRHLFDVDAGAALLALARAEVREPAELRALLWAEHEVADARWKLRHGFRTAADLARTEPEALAQLAGLAGHPRWWARYAAVRIAADEPALRSAVPLDELARDPHPLVSAAASAAR